MAELFNVYFRAEIAPNAEPEAVRRQLGALFKADGATLDRLFSGNAQLIRKHCSAEEAARYREAMLRAGAVAQVLPVQAPEAAPEAAPVPAPPAETSASLEAGFTLAEPGARLGPVAPAAPTPPDTSHLSLAEAGEPIPGLARAAPPPAPDTSALQLAPAGSDVLEARFRQRDRSSDTGADGGRSA